MPSLFDQEDELADAGKRLAETIMEPTKQMAEALSMVAELLTRHQERIDLISQSFRGFHDWCHEQLEKLSDELASQDGRLASQDGRLSALEAQVSELEHLVEMLDRDRAE